ncbi:low affinity immunoglobulin gamma Fc region receptor II-like isoform X2 [Dicentrarchus labrax]|uniref:low affinity immunoglobulin gamma Fc region receptor II-like isoform X2 n=1 Tax=Dicentrarchus labrax TaxID=13489 RepID=UPI0021F5E9AD|nr:low affinity immunoglobulin gamma Fc region receptor II-like isoform X2 [Dicentrarchus labrax]
MEVRGLCIRLLTCVIILLGAHFQRSYTQEDVSDAAFRITTDRLQFFEYESVSFHCEALNGLTQLRGIRNTKEFIPNCDTKRASALTCTIKEAYDTDSGVYWCETKRGEKSNTVNITVTAGSVILESPVMMMEGHTVTLRCRYKTASTNLQADFYKDDIHVERSPENEMTIKNVSKSNEGLYKCIISGVGASPGSWLAVGVNHPFHRTSPQVRTPLLVAVTILMVALVLLVLGFLQIRKHRVFYPSVMLCFSSKTPAASQSGEEDQNVSGEDSADDPDGVTYAVVVLKQRKNKDPADAADNLSLKTKRSRKPQRERDDDESSLQPIYSTLKTKCESLNTPAAEDSSVTEEEPLYSPVRKATKSRD